MPISAFYLQGLCVEMLQKYKHVPSMISKTAFYLPVGNYSDTMWYIRAYAYIYITLYTLFHTIYMSTQERTLTVIHGNTCAEFLGNFSYPVSSQQRPRIETAWPPSSSSLSASGDEQWRFSFKMFKENVRRVGGKKKQEDNTTKYVLMVQSTQIRPARLWDREQL